MCGAYNQRWNGEAWVPLWTLKASPLHCHQNFFFWNLSPYCKAHSQPLRGPSFLTVPEPSENKSKYTYLVSCHQSLGRGLSLDACFGWRVRALEGPSEHLPKSLVLGHPESSQPGRLFREMLLVSLWVVLHLLWSAVCRPGMGQETGAP